MRRLMIVVLTGALLAIFATPAVARTNSEPPPTTPGVWGTESVLRAQGFVAADVSYRIGGTQDVVVVYDGGGPVNPLEALRDIEETVWAHEQYRFDHLVIQNGIQAPIAVSYADLAAAFGPRPQGFDKHPLAGVAAVGAFPSLGDDANAYRGAAEQFRDVLIAVGGAAVLTVLAFVLVGLFRTRRRVPDERDDRLFA